MNVDTARLGLQRRLDLSRTIEVVLLSDDFKRSNSLVFLDKIVLNKMINILN